MADSGKRIKFSIIIPVYNGRETICRAIASVLAQSYKEYEIIVVNDCSSDDSADVIKNNFGSIVRLIDKEKNEGSSVARNDGMDVATGNYVAFLDADDTWHTDKLMLLSIALEANPHIALLYHTYTLADISKMKLPAELRVYKVPFRKLLVRNPMATSCMVIANDPAIRFEPTMRYSEDYELGMRLGYQYGTYMIDIPLTQIYRLFTTAGGISSNKWKMRKGELRAYSRLAKLNPGFILLLPLLIAYSLLKHSYKAIRG